MILASFLLSLPLPAQEESILDPTAWRSPSGEFELSVDPCRPDGAGPAQHTLTRAGRQLWSAEKPFTLWRASLTDDGVAIGYAYTRGIHGGDGELQAIRLDALGNATICRTTPRHSPRAVHGAPGPFARQILLQADTDRAAIGVEGGFWYLKISTGERLPPFRFDGDRSSWTESQPIVVSSIAVPVPEPAPIALARLGSFEFGRPRVSGTGIHDVHEFCIDDRGRFGWVRLSQNGEAWELVLFDDQGRLAARIDLGDLRRAADSKGSGRPRFVWLEKDSWLVTVYEPGPPATWPGSYPEQRRDPGCSIGWLVDVGTGSVREAEAFRCPEIWDLAALPGGGVVALVNRREQYTSESTVIGFDREARPIWKVESTSAPSDRSHLFAPKALGATSDGRIVVLDGVRGILQYFDGAGHFLTAVEPAVAWEDPPGRLDWLSMDHDGGSIVGEHFRSHRIRRVGPAGEACGNLAPRSLEGRDLPGHPVVRAPNGRLWTYEGDALLRLGEDGLVDLALGDPVCTDQPGDLGAVEVDLAGRIYAQDRRSHAVHVFDPEGLPLRLCTPLPADFTSVPRPDGLSVTPDGSVYLRSTGSRFPQGIRFLAFGPDGRRVGWVSVQLDRVCEEWRFGPVGREWWVVGFRKLFLVDRDGAPMRSIAREPDRRWLREITDGAVAPDGSIAILSRASSGTTEGRRALHVYDPEGEPLQTFELPPDVRSWCRALVWTGRWLFVARTGGRFQVIDTATGDQRVFKPGGFATERTLEPFLSAGGRELWLVDRDAKRVHRHSLPGD